MINAPFIEELVNRLSAVLPEGVTDLQQDVEKNVRAVVQSTLSKFNLVTREEFEVQTKVLANSRAKLVQLEQRVAELEQRLRQ